VLQACFAIIKNPGRLWNNGDLENIMIAAVIIHNMIIEDERESSFENIFDYHQESTQNSRTESTSRTQHNAELFLLRHQAVRSRSTHQMLKEDLINHLWNKRGAEDIDSDDGSADDS
jgi:hypothetical protein